MDWANEVRLVGRITAAAESIVLPSGTELTKFRVSVPRAKAPRKGAVDAVDCVTDLARIRKTLNLLDVGDCVEVTGALRRRFWRSGEGVASRTEVAVTGLGVMR